MEPRSFTCHLGPTRATLVTDHRRVVDYLRNFHPVTDGAAAGAWEVEATVGPVDRAMTVNRWGVGYAAEPVTGRLRLRCPDPDRLAVTARTTVREALVDYCERRRYVMLHASAVADDRRVVVFVGDHAAGKTTLALRAVLFHGMRYLANEHLIVYADPPGVGGPDGADRTAGAPDPGAVDGVTDGPEPAGRLRLATLPGPVALRIGTYLDLADRLPPPFDTEGLDVDAYRSVPRERRYRSTDRVIYTFPRLGQRHPDLVDLREAATGPAVLVVLAGYATTGARSEPAAVADPVDALTAHLRTDWMFTPWLNQRYLPRRERRPAEYLADARGLLGALARRATVARWRHHGDPGPLLRMAAPGGRL